MQLTKKLNNTKQIQSLAQTLDTLLPKLMSGKLSLIDKWKIKSDSGFEGLKDFQD